MIYTKSSTIRKQVKFWRQFNLMFGLFFFSWLATWRPAAEFILRFAVKHKCLKLVDEKPAANAKSVFNIHHPIEDLLVAWRVEFSKEFMNRDVNFISILRRIVWLNYTPSKMFQLESLDQTFSVEILRKSRGINSRKGIKVWNDDVTLELLWRSFSGPLNIMKSSKKLLWLINTCAVNNKNI